MSFFFVMNLGKNPERCCGGDSVLRGTDATIATGTGQNTIVKK
jgi:hypothetical protein